MRKFLRKTITIAMAVIMVLGTAAFAYAAPITVTYNGSVFSYQSGGGKPAENMHGIFTTTAGNPAYCAEHGIPSPMGDRVGNSISLDAHVYDNAQIRKILFYGWQGPGQWSGFNDYAYNGVYQIGFTGNYAQSKAQACGIAVTSMALCKAYGGNGRWYNVSGLTAFENYIASQPDPAGFAAYLIPSGSNATQDLFAWEYNPSGYLTLTKAVANNNHLVNLCPENYSLAGAEYTVYSNANLTGAVGTLVTDAAGRANTLTLPPATYYVKETRAPKGFKLDNRVYTVTVMPGNTATVSCADEPVFDPLELVVYKKATFDSDKNLSLEGAEYTVKYYKEYLNTEDEVKAAAPFRTWVFKTKLDVNGNASFKFNDNWKVGGDELFKNERGNPIGLLGTYVVEETKAPKGFAKTEGIISLQHVKKGNTFDTVEVLKDITDVEKPQTVSITVQKVDSETGEKVPQGHGSFAGAEFEVTHFDAATNKDEVVGTIVLDDTGRGTLGGLKPEIYKLHEVKAPNGYLLNDEVIEIKAGIKEINTANFDYYVEVKETPTTTVINKYEVVDGKEIPVIGAKLQILDTKGHIVEEFVTDGQKIEFKGLSVGQYTLHEVEAPEGNLLAKDIEFEIVEGEAVTVVNMEDEYTKLEISKTDITTGKELPGAKLQILDKDGNVAYEWISEDKPHYIERVKPGEYILHEESAPRGYLVAEDVSFTVEANGEIQKVEMKDAPKVGYATFTFTGGKTDTNIIMPKTSDNTNIELYIGLMVATGILAAMAARKEYRRK